MAASSTISSKGQITVPVEIRNRLGLHPGDRVEFCVEDGHTTLRPIRKENNALDEYIGALPYDDPNTSAVSFWREMRGHDPAENFADNLKDEDDL